LKSRPLYGGNSKLTNQKTTTITAI